jgi:hypothetical protein
MLLQRFNFKIYFKYVIDDVQQTENVFYCYCCVCVCFVFNISLSHTNECDKSSKSKCKIMKSYSVNYWLAQWCDLHDLYLITTYFKYIYSPDLWILTFLTNVPYFNEIFKYPISYKTMLPFYTFYWNI